MHDFQKTAGLRASDADDLNRALFELRRQRIMAHRAYEEKPPAKHLSLAQRLTKFEEASRRRTDAEAAEDHAWDAAPTRGRELF